MKTASTPRSKMAPFLLYTSNMRDHVIFPAAITVGILLSGLLLYGTPRYANAQGTGCHIATAEEVEAGAPPGRPVCPADAEAGITDDAGQAKEFLRSILCRPDGDNYGGMGPDGTIKGLDAKFAQCAAKFLRSAIGSGIPVCVREGARTVAKQEEYVKRGIIACKRGAACEHPRGIAIDVNTNSHENYARLHQMGPQFGVVFYLGFADQYHFVPSNGGGGCTGGGVTATEGAPSSQLSDAIRRALGQQQQQPPQPPPPPQQQSQPAPSAQPTQSAQPNTSVQSGTPTETPQTNPVSSLINTNINTSGNTNTNSTKASSTATSSFDLIDQYLDELDPVSNSIDVGSIVDISLNPDTSDATTLDGKKSTSTLRATGTLALSQTLNVPQTFTSTDLGKNPPSPSAPGQNTLTLQVLETMKQTLLYAVNYLKPFVTPFGGYRPQYYGE